MARVMRLEGGPKHGVMVQVPEYGEPDSPRAVPDKIDINLARRPSDYDPCTAGRDDFTYFAQYKFNGIRNCYEYVRTISTDDDQLPD